MAGNAGPAYDGLLAYRPAPNQDDEEHMEFELMSGSGPDVDNAELQGSTALLCSFQNITSPSNFERENVKIKTFNDLVTAIFPATTTMPCESLVRPTGNHWGPMRIGPTDASK
jgi:hypothetical protein